MKLKNTRYDLDLNIADYLIEYVKSMINKWKKIKEKINE